jgi:acetyltransferase-like isoleucine patch superfamily enzyme
MKRIMLNRFVKLPKLDTKRKRIQIEAIIVTLFSVFLLLRKALPEGLTSPIGGINLRNSSNAKAIREAWGLGDSGSLLEVALTWANFQQLDPTTQFWMVRVWSPGLAIIEIPLIWLEEVGIPIFWSLLAITTCLWMTLIFLLWSKVAPIAGRLVVFLILVIFLFSWDFEYLFRTGLFYTEGISIATLILGLFIITWSVIHSNQLNNKFAFIGGSLVGISIWVRHVNDNGLLLILGSTLLFFVLVRKPNRFLTILRTRSNLIESQFLLIFSLVAFAVTVPWRFLAHFVFQGAAFLMSSASYLVGPGLWAKPGSGTAQYWGGFGMNWACKIDIQTCLSLPDETNGITGRSRLILLAIRAAIQNPFEYISERWSSLSVNWVPGFKDINSIYDVIGMAYLAIIVGIVYLFIRVSSSRKNLVALIWLPFLIAQIAQLLLIHYESRYFITLRFLLLGLLVSLLLVWRLERNSLMNNNSELAPFVHKKAICESKNVGSGTRIWAFSHVLKNARVGKDCNICENVFIENLVVIGDRVTVKNGVQLWDGLTLEDDVFIGPNVTFTNDKYPRSKKYPDEYLQTVVQKGASIGANSTILPGITIGQCAMIGAGSVVTKDVPDFTLVVGNPARIKRVISKPEE